MWWNNSCLQSMGCHKMPSVVSLSLSTDTRKNNNREEQFKQLQTISLFCEFDDVVTVQKQADLIKDCHSVGFASSNWHVSKNRFTKIIKFISNWKLFKHAIVVNCHFIMHGLFLFHWFLCFFSSSLAYICNIDDCSCTWLHSIGDLQSNWAIFI